VKDCAQSYIASANNADPTRQRTRRICDVRLGEPAPIAEVIRLSGVLSFVGNIGIYTFTQTL
jgi:hypothetical protein